MTPKATRERLRELDQQATAGPWIPVEGEHGFARRYNEVIVVTDDPDIVLSVAQMADLREDHVNAELIAEMRNALPQLLADSETLAQIRELDLACDTNDEFANRVTALLDPTTKAGHMTTDQKGEK